MSARCPDACGATSPWRKREVVIATLLMLSVAGAEAAAQQPDIAPELLARMAKEKEARRACKASLVRRAAMTACSPDAGQSSWLASKIDASDLDIRAAALGLDALNARLV